MNLKTISVIALSNRDYQNLSEKLDEVVRWIKLAKLEGAQLVVLPELLNQFRDDGQEISLIELAFDDWEKETKVLFQAATSLNVWLTIPVLHKVESKLFNSFFLISPQGVAVWRFDKLSPTPAELKAGVVPGNVSTYDWEGIRLGGAICFDTCFGDTFYKQIELGVELFLIPSQWPGGASVSFFCQRYGVRAALSYPAWSKIVDIDGAARVEGGYRQESLRFGFGAPVYTATLNFDRVALFGDINQSQIVRIREKYGSRVRIDFDQMNCLWFLESVDPDLHEKAILEEFELISARDYFGDCRRKISLHQNDES